MARAAGERPAASGARLKLRLYVAGGAPNSAAARTNLRAMLDEHGIRDVEVEIIDVLVDPHRGLRDRVLVTPTLVRIAPLPEHRVVGNLRDRAALVAVLGLDRGDDRDG